jgi:hypothetical protein
MKLLVVMGLLSILSTRTTMDPGPPEVHVGYSVTFWELTPEFPYGKDNCTVDFFVSGAKSPLKVTALCDEMPRVYVVGASPSRAIFFVVRDNGNRILGTAYKIVKGQMSVIWEYLSSADIVVTSPESGTLKVEVWREGDEAEGIEGDRSLHRYIHTIKFP